MSDTPRFDSAQLNFALEQRVAAHDYHEYIISGSVKLLLAIASKTIRDKMAIGNEDSFNYRFGFKATSTVRPLVIDFQNRHDLLDNEIRWLKRAGHLRVTRKELIIDTSRLIPICGWFYVVAYSLLFCNAIISLSFLDVAVSWKRDLTLIAVGTTWIFIIAMLVKAFITPWRTMKRAGAIPSKVNKKYSFESWYARKK